MSVALEVQRYDAGWARGFQRERSRTVSEWADAHRILSRRSSAEHGKWDTSRTPYLREIMDHLSSGHPAQRIVFVKGAQVGGTECGNNWVGYVMHRDPGPMMIVWPTVEVAETNSKTRIAPLLEETPVLSKLVSDPRSRDSGNTLRTKEFEGGQLSIRGANSSAGLRSLPIRALFLDEVDEFPGDLGGQGDPVELAVARTATFQSTRKVFLVSTPTIRGFSRIEKEFEKSDQRRYFVPCPSCGEWDWIQWKNIRFQRHKPDTARLVCVACEEQLEERWKTQMLARGEWRPTAESTGGIVGFHLSALYSPLGWKSWADCVGQFEEAHNDPPKLKTWVNTVLGETFEERGDGVEMDTLRGRASVEKLERRKVPEGVGAIVASVDVQSDRLEVVVKGYGAGEESWLLDFEQLHGDPARGKVWGELDAFLRQELEHENGQRMKVERVVVDSGGLHTEQVYRYCKSRGAGVYPIKGASTYGDPLVKRPSRRNKYRVALFPLCVNTGKDIVMSRLAINTPGPGFIHLPPWVDDEYLDQLTAEKAIRKHVRGAGVVRVWEKVKDQNEALDLEVYALAALYISGRTFIRSLPERAAKFAKPPEKGKAKPKPMPTLSTPGDLVSRRRRRRGWVDSWKG